MVRIGILSEANLLALFFAFFLFDFCLFVNWEFILKRRSNA